MMVSAADLRVTVTNGPPGPATLYITLFDSADSFSASRAMVSQKAGMHDGVAQWVFGGLPEGLYATKSFAALHSKRKSPSIGIIAGLTLHSSGMRQKRLAAHFER